MTSAQITELNSKVKRRNSSVAFLGVSRIPLIVDSAGERRLARLEK
jgi:hypothetical protein